MVYEQPESKIISTVSLPKWMCEFESLATCSPKHDFVLVIVVSGGMFLGRNGSVNGLINGETFFLTNLVVLQMLSLSCQKLSITFYSLSLMALSCPLVFDTESELDRGGIWVLRLFVPLAFTFPDLLMVGWGGLSIPIPQDSTLVTESKSDFTSHFSEAT